MVHRRPGRRAEPVAPRQDRDRHPGRGSDRHARSTIRGCFSIPWIYFVEPGTLRLLDSDVPILREFLLRGGTAMFDDFHGPIEWDNFAREMRRVFPDREIVEVPKDHPVFTCFYKIDGYPAGGRHRIVHRRADLGEGRLRRRICARSSTTPAGR